MLTPNPELYQDHCPPCGYELCWMDKHYYDECPMCGTPYTEEVKATWTR